MAEIMCEDQQSGDQELQVNQPHVSLQSLFYHGAVVSGNGFQLLQPVLLDTKTCELLSKSVLT
jgi:hypothetical protein